VHPGVELVRTRFFRANSVLSKLDFPTLDRPAKATSALVQGGAVRESENPNAKLDSTIVGLPALFTAFTRVTLRRILANCEPIDVSIHPRLQLESANANLNNSPACER
jgi:hypothetical protein